MICCNHNSFLAIIDMKLLHHGRPMERISVRNDLLYGLKSGIKCIANTSDNAVNIDRNSLDSLPLTSYPVFLSARWCPSPPPMFVQFGLLATLQSDHRLVVYGMPSFTPRRMSCTPIDPQWTSLIDLTPYLQSFRITADLNLSLHSTSMGWFQPLLSNDHSTPMTQYLVVGTKESVLIVFRFKFQSDNPSPDSIKVETMGHFLSSSISTDSVQSINGMAISQIECARWNEDILMAIGLKNGSFEIWKCKCPKHNVSKCSPNAFPEFHRVQHPDIVLNGSYGTISGLKWHSNTDSIALVISTRRIIYVLQIRTYRNALKFEVHSSSKWMNNKTARFYPKMAINGLEIIRIGNDNVIITISCDGVVNGWTFPECALIANQSQNEEIERTFNQSIDSQNGSNLYTKLMVEICNKIRDDISSEIADISSTSNLPLKRISSLGMAVDPNGLVLAVIYPDAQRVYDSKCREPQRLYLYPVSVDHDSMYELVHSLHCDPQRVLHPISMVIAMDCFVPFHRIMARRFMSYFDTTFGHWFQSEDVDDEDGDQQMNGDTNSREQGHMHCAVTIDVVMEQEDSLRFCLLMFRYFVSRVRPYDGMEDNVALKKMNAMICGIMEVLLQCHCLKTLGSFLELTNGRNGKYELKSSENRKHEYLPIYLQFMWFLVSYISNRAHNYLSKIFSVLHRELLKCLVRAFERLKDDEYGMKCNRVIQCIYPLDDDDVESEDEREDDDTHWTIQCEKFDCCPVCNKMVAVAMHTGLCGSDEDKQRHQLSRCCVSFRIIGTEKVLYCCCCNGVTTEEMTKRLVQMRQRSSLSQSTKTGSVVDQCFNHCLPFHCSLCKVPLVQVLTD